MSVQFIILSCIAGYLALLLFISVLTSKETDNRTFFLAQKNAPWYLVAWGMIGASLSGVTFISVPGWVGTSQFGYLQMVLGYLLGYVVIAFVLMPLYYRLNLTTIYGYLGQRFGFWSYKTGAFFFLISRLIGASFRLYLVAMVLQEFVFNDWSIPFWVTVFLTLLFIWVYTFRSGIKTIIWTDTLQTLFMLLSVIISIGLIASTLELNISALAKTVFESKYAKVFFWDWQEKQFFLKQFISGAFIAIVMTGLDQDMMQKNLTCRNLKDAQKNMITFSIILIFVNILFLILGALLYIYAYSQKINIPDKTDLLFPMLALHHLGSLMAIVFIIGLIAAAYSSADSALTALTTSFCVDFLDFEKGKENIKLRKIVHIGFALLTLTIIILFRTIHDEAIISKLFTIAGYTYGPLLGLYSFGLFTHWHIRDRLAPFVCIIAPIACYSINLHSKKLFFGYQLGFELLVLNGLLTFIGLIIITKQKNN